MNPFFRFWTLALFIAFFARTSMALITLQDLKRVDMTEVRRSPQLKEIDPVEFERRLGTEGVEGEVHGVHGDHNLFVFTYRSPADFFDSSNMSVLPKSSEVEAGLLKLQRHDRVRIKGAIIENPSKQKHLEISSFEVLKAFENPYHPPAYEYQTELPRDLRDKTKAKFLVHAVDPSGKVLVLEYGDAIVPVFVKGDPAALVKSLYRNDLVEVHYEIMRHPERPTHLKLSTKVDRPLVVLESVLPRTGQPADVSGELVLFPQSPLIKFDVFAVYEKLDGGLQRQYTLINFNSMEVFEAMRKKLGDAWATAPQDFVNGRSKLVHKKIKVRAKGKFSISDPNQANVQILVDKIEDLQVL